MRHPESFFVFTSPKLANHNRAIVFYSYKCDCLHTLFIIISRSIHMRAKNKEILIISILVPLAVGALSALFSGNMMNSTYKQPSFSPPSYLFPIVWTILYFLMGISSYLVYTSDSALKVQALKVYALQLFFNFFWSILFFRFSLYGLSFLWLVVLIGLICFMIYFFYKVQPIAAYLQIPYLLWCIFAAYLNYAVYRIN